ncbi:MAG: multicopper oxidase domain-containing protein, partial [Gemmatimonadales bacterium]
MWARSALCATALGLRAVTATAAQVPHPASLCARDTSRLAPAADLYCIDLVPTPDFLAAAGAVELRRVATPFGAALTSDGRHVWDLRITLAGLPPLAAGAAYVAWITTPTFDRVIRLGAVGNGRMDAGSVALNTFIVLVSLERSADVTTRQGRLVLRGMSAGNLMRPYDFTALPPQASPSPHGHGQDGGDGWQVPPMHPDVPAMIPGLETLRPDVTPLRPGKGIDPGGLPRTRPRRLITLADGDSLALEAGLLRRSVAGRNFVAYGFNGQWPGPLIQVDRAATIVVNFTNHLDQPTTVHWHGIRLDNRFDGVPHVTQD